MRRSATCLALFITLLSALSLSAFLLATPARANSIIDQIRAQAQRDFGASNLTAGYSALIEFAVVDDVSADSYFIGNEPGQLDVEIYKAPIPFTIGRTKNNWRFFGQTTFGYLIAKQSIQSFGPDLPSENIKSRWTAFGAAFGVGVEIPITKRLTIEPFVFLGYARLENKATYSGVLSDTLFRPALDRLLFDWSLDAITYGGSFAIGYRFSIRELKVKLRLNLTRTEVQAVRVQADFGKFRNSLTSIKSAAEFTHPLPIRLYGRRLAIVFLFANTTFVGPDADALGFNYFFETGLALQLDLTGYNLPMTRIRLGGTAVFGRNISGYSVLLKASF